MPGIDQRTPNLQAQLQSNSRVDLARSTDQAISRTSAQSSIAAKKIVQANTEKNLEVDNISKDAIDKLLTQKEDQDRSRNELKKQASSQADTFHNKDSHPLRHSVSVSQIVADVNEKKQRQQESQRFAQNINSSQIGQARAKINNPQARVASEEAQASALVASAFQDTVDPDSKNEEKQAQKLLQEIHDFAGEKGKAFVSFARREIEKGRYAEIKDLIAGFHQTIQNDSLTASGMVKAGNERLLTVKSMVGILNIDEQKIINQAMVERSDVSSDFKLTQKILRNMVSQERVAPPAFNKPFKPTKIDDAIRFVSEISSNVLTAPWDKVA
jgi:hypothetical protein